MERVLEVRRKDTLVKKEKNKDNRIPLVVTYHPDLSPVGHQQTLAHATPQR